MARGRGKWSKHTVMNLSPALKPVLPHTRKMSEEVFHDFIKRYHHLIVKPSNGEGGAGVIQITSLSEQRFRIHHGRSRTVVRLENLYPTIRRITSRRSKTTYLVQQRIPLLRIKGQPFDVRVMAQKHKVEGWIVTGIMAKRAGRGYFITNLVRSKGRALPLSTAIRQSDYAGPVSIRELESRLQQIALTAVKHLQKYYRIHTVGFDMGIDHKGNVWIIEANFRPDKSYFRRLKDQSMYRRIMAVYRQRSSSRPTAGGTRISDGP